MENFADRVKKLIEHHNLNEFAFSRRIGKSNTGVVKVVRGESKPNLEMIEAILDSFPDLNPSWLIAGEGEMLRNEPQSAKAQESDYLADYLQKLEEQFNRLLHQLESKDQQLQTKDQQIESKDRQIEKLMDLLGKHDVSEETACKIIDFGELKLSADFKQIG